MALLRDKHLPHPGNPKGEPNLGEREFEIGLDEQYKQAGASGTVESVDTKTKRNDRSEDYYDTLRMERLHYQNRQYSLDLAEREIALTERRNRENERELAAKNREYSTHLANLAAGEHYRHGYDKLQNLEAIEAVSNKHVFDGYNIEALRSAVNVAIAEAFKRYEEAPKK
jgi:hypothetical protein